MMRRLFCLACVWGVVAATPAAAVDACYNDAQMHAEQLLRLHSELMVITVSCLTASNGQPLAGLYGDFTQKHIRVLHDAEETMKNYYQHHAKGDPVDHLDRLRTLLANEFGQKSAAMGAQQFCAAYRDKVLQFDAGTAADVENEAARMAASDPALASRCGAKILRRKGG